MRTFLLSLALLTATFLSAKVQKQTLPVDPEEMDPNYIMDYYYPQKIYGDLKLDSVVMKDGRALVGWQYYCIFDANGRLTKIESFSSYRYQIFCNYDDDGNCIQTVAKMPNMYTVSWEEVQKAEFKRDNKGRAIEQINSVYTDSKWQPVSKSEATYDAHDNGTLWTDYDYQTDLGTWKTSAIYKHEYTYNDKGMKTQGVHSSWYSDDGWTMLDKEEYEYDAQGRETLHMDYNWDDNTSNWVQNEKITTAYSDPSDDGVVYVLVHTQEWNSNTGNWDSQSLSASTYTNGKQTEYKYSQMENSQLVLKYTRTITYNAKDQVILKETVYTSGSKYRTEYMYDDFGNRIAELQSEDGETKYTCRWYFSAREEEQQALNQTTIDKRPTTNKLLHNGLMLIKRGEMVYSIDGQLVK